MDGFNKQLSNGEETTECLVRKQNITGISVTSLIVDIFLSHTCNIFVCFVSLLFLFLHEQLLHCPLEHKRIPIVFITSIAVTSCHKECMNHPQFLSNPIQLDHESQCSSRQSNTVRVKKEQKCCSIYCKCDKEKCQIAAIFLLRTKHYLIWIIVCWSHLAYCLN